MDKKAINEQLKYKRIELKDRLWTGCLLAVLEKWRVVLGCGLKAQLFLTERFKFGINFFYFIKPATNVPPHSVPLEEVIGIGVLLVVFIAKSFPIITARFVVSLALTASQSLSGTAMNFAAWSVVLFKIALRFKLTPYKMCFTVSWPRIEITP